MGCPSEDRGALPERAIREQLDRILASGTFSRSERLSSFLRFIVDETLAGRGPTLKEQVLASELYGRRGNSEAQDDSTVRTDARRVRDKLREYYAEFPHASVIIALPKGGYTPVFDLNPSAPVVLPLPPSGHEQPQPTSASRVSRTGWVAALGLTALLAAVSLRLPSRSGDQDWRPIPVSVLPGVEGAPSLSPDGNLVAFAWTGSADRDSQTDIYVKAVGSEALLRLTDTPASESSPAWSPDGSQIAFVRRGEGIFIMSQLGGSERKVSDSGTSPGWTPDSQFLLIRDRVADRPFGIFRISLETLERRQITQPLGGNGDWRFEVSPDGKTLAFIRSHRGGVEDVYIVGVNGGEPDRRTNWKAAVGTVVWSPDGRDLIFSLGYGYPLSLWRVPARGVRPERGTRLALAMPANSPSVSRPRPGQAARMAFLRVYHDITLQVLELDTRPSNETIRGVRALCDSTLVDYPGSFSPDGNNVAFTSGRKAKPASSFLDEGQLWVATTDCSDLRQITFLHAPNVGRPSWSPNGGEITFEATVDGDTDIYIVSARGGKPRRVTTEPSIDTFPHWSQHGAWIYYTSDRSGRREIWKIAVDGGAAEQVTRNGGFDPIESIDGKSVYYVHPGGGPAAPTLRRIDVIGGGDTVILPRVLAAHWAVTERGVFFISREREFDAVDLSTYDGRRVQRVGLLPFRVATIGDIGRFTVSRDGKQALTHKIDRWDSDIMLLDNFR